MGEIISVPTKKGIDLAEFLRKQLCKYSEKHFDSTEGIEALVISYGVDVFYVNWILHEMSILKKPNTSMEEALDFKLLNLKKLILFDIKDESSVAH